MLEHTHRHQVVKLAEALKDIISALDKEYNESSKQLESVELVRKKVAKTHHPNPFMFLFFVSDIVKVSFTHIHCCIRIDVEWEQDLVFMQVPIEKYRNPIDKCFDYSKNK